MKHTWADALEVEVEEIEGYPCVRLRGEGECAGAQRLGRTLVHLIETGYTQIILDTREVRYLDPTCADALEEAVEKMNETGGVLVVVDQSLPVERSLKLLNLDRMAHTVPTVGQAVTYLDWHE